MNSVSSSAAPLALSVWRRVAIIRYIGWRLAPVFGEVCVNVYSLKLSANSEQYKSQFQ